MSKKLPKHTGLAFSFAGLGALLALFIASPLDDLGIAYLIARSNETHKTP